MELALISCVTVSLCLSMNMALAVSLSRPNCTKTFGNVTIPYPFGIVAESSASSWFTVACQDSSFPPRLVLSSINMEIENISLDDATVRVIEPVSPMNCSEELRNLSLGRSLIGSPFTISAQNSLALLGCGKSLRLHANDEKVRICMSVCGFSSDNGCNGVNCCQIQIPAGLQELQYSYVRIRGSSIDKNSYGYALLTERKWFQEDYKTYAGLHSNLSNPFDEGFRSAKMLLEWKVENNMTRSSTYSSCRYMNATASPTRPCSCTSDTKNPASIGIVSAVGSALLLIAAMWCYRVARKRMKANRKKRFFTRNGGVLLEKHLYSTDNGVEKTKLFDAKELAQATDKYNENRVLGRGGQGTVYKGMLKDGRVVAVKKSKKVEKDDIELFINEVVVLSQINHRHVVKLLGCCLETEVPLLVYEFIPNGTLFEHIQDPNEEFPLTWEIRIRIAIEVASALSYLHSGASTPIYHRDIKSTNILLDNKYRAKVADFGTSRTISIDQTHLTTRVLGTFGYLDPEYFQSSQFTDKSDVYSFGVVVVELLTGEKAISSVRKEEGRSLITYFLHSMEKKQLFDILDPRVLNEGQKEEIMAVAQLARRCLHLKGRKRPTMREVAAELEGIQTRKPGSGFHHNPDETEYQSMSVELYDSRDISSNSSSMQFDTNPTSTSDVRPLLV